MVSGLALMPQAKTRQAGVAVHFNKLSTGESRRVWPYSVA